MFNELGLWQRVQNGHLMTVVLAESHPSPPRADEPTCTMSQYIAYIEFNGTKVAEVHQYLRRDGDLGGSGLPDPKRLLVDGVLYVLDA